MTRPRLAPTLADPAARVLLGAFVAVNLLLATTGGGPAPWATWSAFAVISVSAALVVLVDSLTDALATTICGCLVLGVVVTVLPLQTSGWPGYAAWPLGACTFVALALTLRGRIRSAWTAMAGMIVACTVWSVAHGDGPLPGVNLIVRHSGTLLIGTLFAVGLARAARTVDDLQTIEQQRSLQRALTATEGTERTRAAEHVLALASTMLERLAGRAAVSAQDRGEMLSLEGRLRDEITAPLLVSDVWNSVAASTRRRGVDVVLLQDTTLDHVPDDTLADAIAWLSDRLVAAGPPRFTARIVDRGEALRVSAQWDRGSALTEIPYAT